MGTRVSLFVTCIVDQMFPAVGLAMAKVLESVGFPVEFREAQTCCGQPAFNTGYRDEARQVARHFLRVFRDAEYVVVPSGSCAAMITHHFAELVEMEATEEFCGFGWTFSVKFAGLSGAMARTKLDSIVKTGARTIVSIDSSCLMQLHGVISRTGLPLPTLHLAEVLASR